MSTYIEQDKRLSEMCCYSFSWKAVLSGVVTALSSQITLTVLGIAFGMAAVNPMRQVNPIAGFSHFGVYWWALSGLVSLAVGCFVAGHLSDTNSEREGEAIGLVTWSVVNVIGVLMVLLTAGGALAGAGKLFGGALSIVMQTGSSAAPTAADQIKRFLPDDLKEINTNQWRSELDVLLKGNSKSDAALTESFDRVFSRNGEALDPANKEALANTISSRANISHDEALSSINRWQAAYEESKAKFEKAKADAELKARAEADRLAKATSTGAGVVFVMLVLGLVTSLYAGKLGVYYRNPEVKITFV